MSIPSRGAYLFAGCAWVVTTLGVCWEAMAEPATDPSFELELAGDLARVQAEIETVLNRRNCADYIVRNTRFLMAQGAETYRPRTEAQLIQLRDQAPQLLDAMFNLRLSLAERLRAFHRDGPVATDCIDAVRRALRYSRFIEELIAEFLVSDRRHDLPTRPLQGSSPSLMLNPAFASLALRSGDLFLVRSPSFISAAIARIGDEDGQFSHLGMLYVADDQRKYVMEALIGSGAVVVPLDDWLSKERDRLLVLRHPDSRLAEKAARDLYDWIESHRRAGKVIRYDYEMDLSDHSELFCAELVGFAFDRASAGELSLPAYPTSLEALLGHPFLNSLGVDSRTTFAPGDAEVDPSLRLVAEWRDLRNTAESRIRDAILSSVLDWMASRNYRLTHRGLLQLGVEAYWGLLRPLGVGKDALPADMKKSYLKSVAALHSVSNRIYKRITPPLREAIERDPLALDYKSILAAAEAYRLEDCERLRAHRRWLRQNPVNFGREDEPARPDLHFLIEAPAGDGCR